MQKSKGTQYSLKKKQLEWQKMAQRIDRTTDKLGMPIDENIKETVIVLNLLGFPTVMSCQGHLDHGTSFAHRCDLRYT